MGKVKVKKKARRNVSVGIAYVQATFNNTTVTITDTKGDTLCWASAGTSGFKGSRKSTPFAGQMAAQQCAEKAAKFGVKELDVDRLTAGGDYQGLTIAPDLGAVGSVHLKHVDLTAEAPPPSLAGATVGGGIMLWLTEGTDTCNSARVTLKHVYIANRTRRIRSTETVWPSETSSSSTRPANGLGSSTIDLAVSMSTSGALTATSSPTLTCHVTISASVSPSPTSGRRNSPDVSVLIRTPP